MWRWQCALRGLAVRPVQTGTLSAACSLILWCCVRSTPTAACYATLWCCVRGAPSAL